MLNGLGVGHGVDLDRLLEASDFICAALGRESHSRVARAMRGKGGSKGDARRLEAEQ
jgi:hydroxymethylglutaryl-CoA lyase